MDLAFANVKASDYQIEALSLKASSLTRTGLSFNEASSFKESPRVLNARRVAAELTSRFNAPQNEKFFLKCAWHLSEDIIWAIYERSLNKRIPLNYFVHACNGELHNQ